MFIQPSAYVCYADHGCAVYSEPLYFGKNIEHARFLGEFLTGFIANPGLRGRDPTVDQVDGVQVYHAGKLWTELPNGRLCYRPCLVGRNVRVALVEEQAAKFPMMMVMKSTWEEKLPLGSSPPSEVEVLQVLLNAHVRGLPQPYDLESAIVRDDRNLEVETRPFPENCGVAFTASTTNFMAKMQSSFVSSHTSKPLAPGANVDDPYLGRVRTRRQQFNEPLEVRRRLTRVLMSYCTPLKEAMRYGGPESLIHIIRDALIVYYEVYKLPKSGFLHGDISLENIVVPMETSVLTGGLTSGTPAFMAPVLLEDEQIPRRTLGHDMESFFAVIIWMATLNPFNESAFLAKPLAIMMLDRKRAAIEIVTAKENWLNNPQGFKKWMIKCFERPYLEDKRFLNCVLKLREILYSDKSSDMNAFVTELLGENDDNEKMEDADPMKEGLFWECMKEMDDYLHESKGCAEMQRIDSQARARDTPESLEQER
ncbi:uncharacterized protein Z518_00225 [Rhinocladiella mackenziei CBS 650.93]|uniref:Fungal-type protein kinase domain-containing protein n=1 Tax=Rhinocladiella mackenziei CBS 650.93 TaxID=1442369 RepID=A0A0D2G3I8_9EURO|nr:uncharacterized protein Z518_00225 [Rhinocladiella mackenziei CBS 650.93]KIX09147.1 hypothetical protein Z518_00225 [Rhinocladiella mackenziei CBS 650.93]